MSILKRQVNSSSDFDHYSASLLITLLYVETHAFPTLNKRIPWKYQLDTFKCSDENLLNFSCHFQNHRSGFLQILQGSTVSWNITPLCFLRSKLCNLHKRDQSKCKFLRIFSACIKNHQILVIFETKNKFFF